MSSHIQLTREAPASIPAAGDVDKLRIFLDDTDGQLKTKDSSNVVNTVWGTALDDLAKTFPGSSVPAEVVAGQTLIANEVLPVGSIAGAVNFDLPALAGVDAGQDLFAVIDAQGSATTHAITITPNGAETIDGVNAAITLDNDYGIRGLIKTSATNWTLIYGATGGSTGGGALTSLQNDSGGAATQAQPVYSSGDGLFNLADASAFSTSRVVGLVSDASISDGVEGNILTSGAIVVPAAVQNGAWAAGEVIYLHTTAGQLTNTSPVPPNTSTVVGTCTNTPGGGNANLIVNITEPLDLTTANPPITYVGSLNETETTAGVERVIGGLIFDGGGVAASRTLYFRWVGSATDPDVTSVATVRLYDLGPEAGPEEAPVLRSTLTIDTSTADEGKVLRKQVQLSPVASPSLTNEIHNTSRIYQVRLHLTVSAGSEVMSVLQASIVVI